MNADELKQLKELARKNFDREEEVCKQKLGTGYTPFRTSGRWENKKDVLVENSLLGMHVLVVGSEAILDKQKYPDTGGDSEQLLLQCLKEMYRKKYAAFDSFAEIPESAALFTHIYEVLEKKKPIWQEEAISMIDPSLRLMLESKCFRLIITTAFDPILEYALRGIWGDEMVVNNILDDLPGKRDIHQDDNRKSEFYDIAPTLFYAFGKAKAGVTSKYALTDDLKVFTIANWLGKYKPNELLQYIRGKDILAVGCDFENWVFRFFWYLLGQEPGEDLKDENFHKRGSVAIMLSGEKNDTERTLDFFENKEIVYYNNSRLFMSLLAPELMPEHCPGQGEIFISYASEDFSTALNIYRYLRAQRQSVWFDIRLKAGDRYEQNITKGIDQCNIFLPILSNQTKEDLLKKKAEGYERYYMKEWHMAEQHDSEARKRQKMFVVIPILIEEYSMKDSTYHNEELIPHCIHASSVFYSSDHITLDSLLNVINEQKKEWQKKVSKNNGYHESYI